MQNREPRQHTHDGPRTGQTSTDEWIMTCQVCGVEFTSGMEELDARDVKDMMEILNPKEDDTDG